jgi:site-specific DNA-methyltransferase (adenine-specific)
MTRGEVEVALGYVSKNDPTRGTGLMYRWEEGDCLPPARTYEELVQIVQAFCPKFDARTHADLKAEWDALTDDYDKARVVLEESDRRPFAVSTRKLTEDIWTFPSVAGYPGKHPCEKPESLLRHMIDCSSKPGALILDPFAGSGATLIAAAKAGRRAVGIEKDERWCEHAANRLSQGTLELEWTA